MLFLFFFLKTVAFFDQVQWWTFLQKIPSWHRNSQLQPFKKWTNQKVLLWILNQSTIRSQNPSNHPEQRYILTWRVRLGKPSVLDNAVCFVALSRPPGICNSHEPVQLFNWAGTGPHKKKTAENNVEGREELPKVDWWELPKVDWWAHFHEIF